MAFHFEVLPDAASIADVVYRLPALPAGVSRDLTRAIAAYTHAVVNGPDDLVETTFDAIKGFDARGIPDVIAKTVYALHKSRSGLTEDGTLVIPQSTPAHASQIDFAGALLDELFRQLPRDWDSARREYLAALLAEQDYDHRIWTPASEAQKAGGAHLPDAIDAELNRLMDMRQSAEARLLDVPARNMAQFATKFLIASGDETQWSGYHDHLCVEAKSILGIDIENADTVADLIQIARIGEPTSDQPVEA